MQKAIADLVVRFADIMFFWYINYHNLHITLFDAEMRVICLGFIWKIKHILKGKKL
jgi:hypothetical protein